MTSVGRGAALLAALAACDSSPSAPVGLEPTVTVPGTAVGVAGPRPDVLTASMEATGVPCGVEPGSMLPSFSTANGLRLSMADFSGGSFGVVAASTTGNVMFDLLNGAASTQVLAADVNDAGQVVGSQTNSNATSTGWIWTKTAGQTLLAPPAPYTSSFAQSNDNTSRVVGYYQQSATIQAAFLWQSGTATILPQAFPGSTATQANAINDAGLVVGAGVPVSATAPNAVRYSIATGSWTDLGRPSGFTSATATAIASNGIVAGWGLNSTGKEQPWVWDNGQFTPIPLVSGALAGRAYGVNKDGDVVGVFFTANDILGRPLAGIRGFYYRAATQTTVIVGTLLATGTRTTRLTAINDAGMAAGFSMTAAGFNAIRYRYDATDPTAITSIGKQVGSCSSLAWGINNDGDIAGHSDFGTFYRGSIWPGADRFTLGDRVWNDTDANGAQDANEPGIPGVTVTINGPNGFQATTTTGLNGVYAFTRLLAGQYTVCVTAGVPAGFTQTYDASAPMTDGCATATVGPNTTDIDFGYTPPRFSLGDRVWNDLNADGVQDASEVGIAGVVLSITGPNSFSATVTTGATGLYTVPNLLAGTYTVCVAASNSGAGQPLAGFSATYDLDGVATPGCANAIVGPGRTDVDFGYTPERFSLGDRVWNDLNADGVQDAGEAGIAGVVISITGPNGFSTTVTTNATGNYTVPNLLAGTYTVCVAAANQTAGQPLAGFSATYDLDGVATPGCANVTVTASRTDVDFGYTPRFTLGDRVWNDLNADGVQDAGEAGIAGVVLSITGPNSFTATVTTGATGLYTVPNLLTGTYTVCVAAGNFGAGQPLAGFSATYDLDGIATPGCANAVVGPNRSDVDFGYTPARFSIGDRVWNDLNGDGVQDAGETGLTGVTLTLSQGATTVATTTTGTNGSYSFPNLLAGSYTVCVTGGVPAGFTQTYDASAPMTDGCATVTVGPSRSDVDFGYTPPRFSLGDRVWNDLNADGVQDGTEVGIAGVVLSITGPNGFSATVTTGTNGLYTVPNLLAGSYTVCVAAANQNAGQPLAGFSATYDLDGVATPGCANANVGPDRTDVDFGYTPARFSIGDRVWNDLNANGVQDAGETGLTGVTVTLSQGATTVATTTTGTNGSYSFPNLLAGSYTVCVTGGVPAGFTQTYDASAPMTDGCATVTVGPNTADIDFGYTPPRFSLGDRVWNDLNADGVQDAGEAGIAGVVLSITGPNSFTATVTTGANGLYTVPNLLAGSYTVCVAAANQNAGQPLAGFSATYDLDGIATPGCANAVVGPNRSDVDFGYTPRFALGDRVWNDLNGDGVQDAGEAGLTGVTVTLSQGATTVATTTTGTNGSYSFPNLLTGSYTVCVTAGVTAGFTQSYDLDGVATANCATVTVGPSRSDVDFGYTPPRFSIGDRVWNDLNGDGVQDAGETGLTGVTLTLSQGATTVATTTTGTNGSYSFPNLLAGSYTVCVTGGVPAGFTQTYDASAPMTDGCATITVGPSTTAIDFGYTPPRFSLGDRVWNDLNADAVQDASEVGIAGVVLSITGPNSFSATVTTGANGLYTVPNLLAGTYTVCVAAANQNAGQPLAGFSATYDLDGTATPGCANAAVGPNRTDVDFGYTPARFSIGDRVWNDLNADGVQDANEVGLANVTLSITGPNGFATTATTNASGNYTFPNLLAGSYTVCVTAGVPAGFTQTYDASAPMTDGCATVTVGPSRTDVDFGYTPPRFSLGDRVWSDLNADGVQDANEAGLTGVTVTLSQGAVTVATTTTGINGSYTFPNLLAGSYKVCVTGGVPAGFTQTYDLDGLATANCATATVGPSRTDVDFGYTPRFTLGDRVWNDLNVNGVQDAGEVGIANVVLTITGPNGFTTTTTTDASGNYTVPNLLTGSYRVCVTSGLPTGFTQTYDLDGLGTANCAMASVGPSRTDVDFGYAPPATGQIGNYTWIDANGNGRQDAGEPSLAGVTLVLGGTRTGTLTSTAAGGYLFTLLPAGSFTVTATAPSGFVATTATAFGTTTGDDSNANPSTVVLPTRISSDLTIDFGFVPLAGAGQGCTPGYWKQSQHFDSWKWYMRTDQLTIVFNLPGLPAPYTSMTLLAALGLDNSDGIGQLFRHGTAALLNAVYQSGVSSPYTAPQVISMVRNAYLSGNATTIANTHLQLSRANELGCPLN